MWRTVILLLLCAVSVSGNDPLDEDWEMVAWDPTGVGGMVWEEHALPSVGSNETSVNSTAIGEVVLPPTRDLFDDAGSIFEAFNISDDAVWRPAGNVSLDFGSAENVLSSGSINSIVDFAFTQQERDIYYKLNALFDTLVGASNSTAEPKAWSFVAFVTLMPLKCSEVRKVAALFDAAMRESNPESEITSIAQRLGSSACGVDGVCPCKDVRHYSQRVMELRSTSKQRALKPPAHFPYAVEIKES